VFSLQLRKDFQSVAVHPAHTRPGSLWLRTNLLVSIIAFTGWQNYAMKLNEWQVLFSAKFYGMR